MSFISLSTVVFIAEVICITFASIIILFKYFYSYWSRQGIPYKTPQIPYGNFKDSATLKKSTGEVMQVLYNEAKSKNLKYIGLYLFHVPNLTVLDPAIIKDMLLKNFEYLTDRGIYYNEKYDPLSAHLAALNGQRWKNVRQKLTPTFTSSKLKKMFQTLIDCTNDLVDCLDEHISKDEPMDIKKTLVNFTIDVIGSCAFGLNVNSFKNPDSQFIKRGINIFKPAGLDRVKMFMSFLCPSLCDFLRLRITNKETDKFFRKLVKDTMDYRENNNVSRNDFMELLIQLKNNGKLDDDDEEIEEDTTQTYLTINEAAAQMFVFFVAGFDTSATTMAFTLYELGRNQDVQKKLREEIVAVLKKHNGEITYDALMEMHYMEKVIQECLRMHPPAMFLQRAVTKDYTIPNTETILKKGTIVFIPVIGLHMDPEYFPNPEKFDPERFTEENKSTRPDFTYIPFGDGPRICIGMRFAQLEIKVAICRLIQRYGFTVSSKNPDPLVLDPRNIITDVKGGIWLNAHKIGQ